MVFLNEEHYAEVHMKTGGPEFDVAALLAGWLPLTGAGWVDVSADVTASLVVSCMVAPVTGPKFDLTIRDESRLVWEEGTPIALVAQHWYDGALGARELVMWGYLQGEGEQTYGRDGEQRGKRTVGYAVEWSNIPVPALSFGRPNLMSAATFSAAKSVAILPDVNLPEEALFGEFTSQATAGGAMAIDGNADTATISDVVAELAPPGVLGNTIANFDGTDLPVPRIHQVYFGRPWGQPIGAGGETGFIGLTCHAQHVTWGDMENAATVPAFYETDVGSPNPAVINNDFVEVDFEAGQGRNGGQAMYVKFKDQSGSAHPENGPYIQWNTGSDWWHHPAKITFWAKARFAGSVGKSLHVQFKPAAPDENTTEEIHLILTDQYVKYSLDMPTMGRYGGVMMRFRSEINGVASEDMIWLLDDLRISVGYSDQLHSDQTGSRFGLAYDNGNGTEGRMILYFDRMAEAGWTIPPEGYLIIADDLGAFNAKFNPGDYQVISMRAKAPLWHFAPLSGARLKTQFGNNPSRVDYDNDAGTDVMVEELIFSGLDWDVGANPQSLRRASPVSTGAVVTEDYPRLGIDTTSGFGSSYWTYDLGPFVAPTLGVSLSDTGLFAQTSNGDYYEADGVVAIGNELITYLTNEDGVLGLVQRGYNPAGAPFGVGHAQGPAVHDAGTPVTPWRAGSAQTGHLVADASVFRKAGKPKILDGKILYSNEIDPAAPSPDFERTAGGVWKLFGHFSNGQSESVRVTAPGAPYVEARWLSYVVANMERHKVTGEAQRGKANEFTARPFLPGSSSLNYWRGRQVSTLSDAIGYLLVTHGGVPSGKFQPDPDIRNIPLDFISIAPNMLQQSLEVPLPSASLMVKADNYGYVSLRATPDSPFFVSPSPVNTWGVGDYRADASVRWERRQRVSQVVVVAREVNAMRVHRVVYPDIAARRGKVLEIKDLTVLSVDQARDFARAAFRQANTQRTPTLTTGHLADLMLLQRDVINLPELDMGGQMVGVNVYVAGYVKRIGRGAQGSLVWRTEVTYKELSVG